MTQEDSTTSNVSLNLPGIGVKTNWPTQYRENFQLLDAFLSGGETIPGAEINTAVVAEELGLPEYDDVANAPQAQGRVVYATGDGASAEGIYKHDGDSYSQIGGAGGLSDGEDFDGQGTASFTNLESLGVEKLQGVADYVIDPDRDDVEEILESSISAGEVIAASSGSQTVGKIEVTANDVTLHLGQLSLSLADGTDDHLLRVLADNVTIEGGRFNGNYQNQSGVSDCVIFDGVDNGTIRDAVVADSRNHGIASNHQNPQIGRNSNITIENCTVTNPGDDCITAHWTDGIDCIANHVSGSRGIQGAGSGYEFEWGTNDVTVIGGSTRDNDATGLICKSGGGEPAYNVTVHGLVASGNNRNYMMNYNASGGGNEAPTGVTLNGCVSLNPSGDFENDILVDGYDVTINGGRFARDSTATGGIRHVENPDRDARLVLTGGLDVEGTTVDDDSGATLVLDNVRFRLGYSLIGTIAHADADVTVRDVDGDGKDLRADGVTVSDLVIDDSDIVTATQNGGAWQRVVMNGWSTNDGDPNSTGEWSGNGREGVNVRDVANGNNYAYVDGGWVAL